LESFAASDQFLQRMFAISDLSVEYWDDIGLYMQWMLLDGLRPQKRRMLCHIFCVGVCGFICEVNVLVLALLVIFNVRRNKALSRLYLIMFSVLVLFFQSR